jgi:uncharacterized protein
VNDRSVTGLAITAVKGTKLHLVDSVELEPMGARGDRRFFLIDDQNRMVNSKQLVELQKVDAYFDADGDRLTLVFGDGVRVSALVPSDGQQVAARFYSGTMPGQLVDGPFSDAISDHVGRPVRLVSAASAVDRPVQGAASLYSKASLERLATEADVAEVDARRFRMLIEIDGIEAHAEDRWVGRSVRVGEAVIHFEGHVGRCLITTRDPDTAEVNLPTLDILREYRNFEATTEPLSFGIYGRVVVPGQIKIGDRVAAL